MDILIVDDHSHLVESIEKNIDWNTLEIEQVYKAFSGEEAKEVLKAHTVDILVTDIRMPGMSGLELINTVKVANQRTKCILLTGYDEFNYAKEAISLHVDDYLLKPVDHHELFLSIQRASIALRKEWDDQGAFQDAQRMLHENMPKLTENLLLELLQGKRYSSQSLQDRLQYFKLQIRPLDTFTLLLVRMEDHFTLPDFQSKSLVEYAISNIAMEVMSEHYYIWQCKDIHDYLVFVLKEKMDPRLSKIKPGQRDQRLEGQAAVLQHHVKIYLRSKVSIVLNKWGTFPNELSYMYQNSLTLMWKNISNGDELLISEYEKDRGFPQNHIAVLYHSPTLQQLFDVANWSKIEETLDLIFEEFAQKHFDSREHLLEVYFHIASAISFFSHKNGLSMNEIIAGDVEKIGDGNQFQNVQQLKDWAYSAVQKMKERTAMDNLNERKHLIRTIQNFVQENIQISTLQMVADYVQLHPAYLSNLYKMHAKENFSDYLYNVRMHKSKELLHQENLKISDVAFQVGYNKPQYFIKLFKNHYGLTPQEYRDRNVKEQ